MSSIVSSLVVHVNSKSGCAHGMVLMIHIVEAWHEGGRNEIASTPIVDQGKAALLNSECTCASVDGPFSTSHCGDTGVLVIAWR